MNFIQYLLRQHTFLTTQLVGIGFVGFESDSLQLYSTTTKVFVLTYMTQAKLRWWYLPVKISTTPLKQVSEHLGGLVKLGVATNPDTTKTFYTVQDTYAGMQHKSQLLSFSQSFN